MGRGDNRYLPPGLAGDPSHEELWIRLRVKNISKVTAQDVQLRFISRKRERGGRENLPSWWLKVSNLNEITVAIPSEFEQYFDIAFVRNNLQTSGVIVFYHAIVQPPLLEWEKEQTRMEGRKETFLQVGFKYDLSFAVVSGNADAKFYKMSLKAIPQGADEAQGSASGEAYLLGRVEVTPPEAVSSREAYSI